MNMDRYEALSEEFRTLLKVLPTLSEGERMDADSRMKTIADQIYPLVEPSQEHIIMATKA